jgi:hypothetical protein
MFIGRALVSWERIFERVKPVSINFELFVREFAFAEETRSLVLDLVVVERLEGFLLFSSQLCLASVFLLITLCSLSPDLSLLLLQVIIGRAPHLALLSHLGHEV